MKSLLTLILLTFVPAAQAHPSHTHLVFANGTLHAHAQWTQGPKVAIESIVELAFKNGADHSSVDAPGPIEVSLWMTQHGHGSSPTEIRQMVDDKGQPILGVYQISKVYFTMGGEWEVLVKLTYPDKSQETKTFKVDLSGGHRH